MYLGVCGKLRMSHNVSHKCVDYMSVCDVNALHWLQFGDF